MKKVLSFLLSLVLVFSSLIPITASAASESDIYNAGLSYLRANGINERTIRLMDEAEICEYANAQSSQTDSSYYAYVYDKNTANVTLEIHTEVFLLMWQMSDY